MGPRGWAVLCFFLLCLLSLTFGQKTTLGPMTTLSPKEDPFSTPCLESNVSVKYGFCFNSEVAILSEAVYRDEPYCLRKYKEVSTCIERMGSVCGNGDVATYLRFMYHESNIDIAAAHACRNLDALRDVVICVSRQVDAIDACLNREWYSDKLYSKLGEASQNQRYCWWMGVVVYCRQMAARRCDYSVVYFMYLFSVYPIECQGRTWLNEVTPAPGQIDLRDCHTHNFVNIFYKCFQPESDITDTNITSVETCKKVFGKRRECTDNLYNSCSKVASLATVVKKYAYPLKMEKIQLVACANWKEIAKGAACMSQFKSLIISCVKDRQVYEMDRITYIKRTDPELAACMVITMEYECRVIYKYKCTEATAYFQYLEMLYPKCKSITVTKPPTTRCNKYNYKDLYLRCLKMENNLVMDLADGFSDQSMCKLRVYEVSKCLMRLYVLCNNTDAAAMAKAMADPLVFGNSSMTYACNNIHKMAEPTFCVKTFQKEIEKCIAEGEATTDVCYAVRQRTHCESVVLKKYRCLHTNEYFEYKKLFMANYCDKKKTDIIGVPAPTCEMQSFYRGMSQCVQSVVEVVDDIKLTVDSCKKSFTKLQECFAKVWTPCGTDSKMANAAKAIFTKDTMSTIKNDDNTCAKIEDLRKVVSCVEAARAVMFNKDCEASLKAPDDTLKAVDDTTPHVDLLCKRTSAVLACYTKDIDSCDKSEVYKDYVNSLLPTKCSATIIFIQPIVLLVVSVVIMCSF